MAHLLYSPSGAERWLSCPASVALGPGEDTSSVYAEEGTAAHDLAARCYLLDYDPRDLIGSTHQGFLVSDEMADAIRIYLDTIKSFELLPGYASTTLERFVESDTLKGFGGTPDCIIHHRKTVTVVDFKYGQGVAVDAVGNSQLLSYGILTASTASALRLCVVQPRAAHPDGPVRIWEPDSETVANFRARVTEAVQSPSETYRSGPWCRWCPHKAACPELYRQTIALAAEEFNLSTMTPERAAEIMSQRSQILAYLNAVESWSHSELEKGRSIPGYKIVHNFGNRRYSVGEDEIIKACRRRKLGKKDIYTAVIKSPAQLEKITDREFVTGLTERPLKGTTVVPNSDRRPAVEGLDAAAEFSGVPEHD